MSYTYGPNENESRWAVFDEHDTAICECDSESDARRIAAALSASSEVEDVIGEYSRDDGRREWWSGGAWLYPGDQIIIRSTEKTEGEL
jgi:hypothetical protein